MIEFVHQSMELTLLYLHLCLEGNDLRMLKYLFYKHGEDKIKGLFLSMNFFI